MAASPELTSDLPRHRPGLARLFSRYFSPWVCERLWQRWDWQFDYNPYVSARRPEVLVLEADNEVVGHISGIPTPLCVAGEISIGLTLSGLVVDERYRMGALRLLKRICRTPPIVASGMNPGAARLFSHCGGVLLESTCSSWTMRRRYAGTIGASMRRRLRRPLVGLVQPAVLRLLGSRVRPAGSAPPVPLPPTRGGFDIRPLRRFGAAYDALWERAQQRFTASLDRHHEYMNWRYVDCPTLSPTCLGLFRSGDELVGVAVGLVRSERDWTGKPCATHGTLAELIMGTTDTEPAEALVAATMQQLDRRGVDTLEAIGFEPVHGPLFENMGFSQQKSEELAVRISLPGGSRQGAGTARGECWYLSAGDGDALYAPAL